MYSSMAAARWVATSIGIPAGGTALEVEYRTGNQSSFRHIPFLNPVLRPIFGGDVFTGSLNFWADAPVAFPEPAVASVGAEPWWLIPVVICERVVGVAARKASSGNIDFIEVFAREQLTPCLGLTPGCRVPLRLLSGKHLRLAAQP